MQGKLGIALKIIDGNVQSEAKWEHCTADEISKAIAYLEIYKKNLVETLENISNTQKTEDTNK